MESITTNVQLWQGLFALLSIWLLTVLAVPGLAEWIATWLHAHSIAVSHWYRAVWHAFREYARVHRTVMEAERGQ